MADSVDKTVQQANGAKTKSGKSLLILLAVIIIVAVVALAALYVLVPHSSGIKPAFSVLAANQTESLSIFTHNISTGFNTSQIAIIYNGNLSISLYGINIVAPMVMAYSKYYNDSRVTINVSSIPVLGNFSIVEVQNDTNYYSCFEGSGNGGSSYEYNCTRISSQASIFQSFNFTGNATQAQSFNSIQVHYGTVNKTSYGSLPCDNVNGYINFNNVSTNGTAVQSLTSSFGSKSSSGNVTFLTCVSDQYKLPLTFQLYAVARNASSTTAISMELAETAFSLFSATNITALPGPLTNSS